MARPLRSVAAALAPALRSPGVVFGTMAKRHMSAGHSIEEEIAHMNTWRQVSYAAIPLTTAFGVYTMAGAEHGHEDVGEKPKYSYMRLRNKAYPWGKCGLFEINGCPESEE